MAKPFTPNTPQPVPIALIAFLRDEPRRPPQPFDKHYPSSARFVPTDHSVTPLSYFSVNSIKFYYSYFNAIISIVC